MVDLETEFSDGSFLVTTNAASAAAMDGPALIRAEYLPVKTGVDELYRRHLDGLSACLREHPNLTARAILTPADLVASQNRMNAIKAAFREEIGGISRAELERLAGTHKKFAGQVHAAIGEELRKRRT